MSVDCWQLDLCSIVIACQPFLLFIFLMDYYGPFRSDLLRVISFIILTNLWSTACCGCADLYLAFYCQKWSLEGGLILFLERIRQARIYDMVNTRLQLALQQQLLILQLANMVLLPLSVHMYSFLPIMRCLQTQTHDCYLPTYLYCRLPLITRRSFLLFNCRQT
jgi:hypothetical protein